MPTSIEVVIVEAEEVPPWLDLPGPVAVADGRWTVSIVRAGTSAGTTSIDVHAKLPNGQVVVLRTTAALWHEVNGVIYGAEARWSGATVMPPRTRIVTAADWPRPRSRPQRLAP